MQPNLPVYAVLLLATTGRVEASTPPDSSPVSTPTPTWTGTDGSYVSSVLSCQSLKDAWNKASTSWLQASHSSYSYSTYTEYSTKWTGNYSGPISTLCDGVPRAPGSAPLATIPTATIVASNPPPFPTPEPTCTYNYRGCELLISSFRSASSSASSASHTAALQSLVSPSCWTDPAQCITPNPEPLCRLDAGSVQLIHWPLSKSPSALCTTTNLLTPTPSTSATPSTITSGTNTFVSPTVYLSFTSLLALLPCATVFPDALLALPPDLPLSSIAFASHAPILATKSLTWDDIASPVPLSAYTAQMSCHPNWGGPRASAAGGDGCRTVFDADYLPYLALPTEPALLTHLDARFGNCSAVFWRKYVFDPPLALTAAGDDNVLAPSTTSAAAAAAQTLQSGSQPTATAVTATTIVPGVTASADPDRPQNVVIDGQTLGPGAVTVVAGSEAVVVGTAAVVVGGSTTVKFTVPTSSESVPGVGWASATAEASTAEATATSVKGGAGRVGVRWGGVVGGLVAVVGWLL